MPLRRALNQARAALELVHQKAVARSAIQLVIYFPVPNNKDAPRAGELPHELLHQVRVLIEDPLAIILNELRIEKSRSPEGHEIVSREHYGVERRGAQHGLENLAVEKAGQTCAVVRTAVGGKTVHA